VLSLLRPAGSIAAGGILLAAVLAAPAAEPEPPGAAGSPAASDDASFDLGASFDWDLVSLEQSNPRFNASVLSGFHSIRSPGVTPSRAWKTGLGILYTRQEQVLVATNTEVFDQQQLILNPKLNRGFLGAFEVGAGFEASWAEGEDVDVQPDGSAVTEPAEAFEASAADVGIKWSLLRTGRLRLALSFDSRIAVNKGAFGTLPATIYNLELDGDVALTSRLSVISNVQYLTTGHLFEDDQFVFDAAGAYSFSDRFRGMLFGTLVEDDEADNVLFFLGIAGQYVFEQHSFTLAIDLQLNEALRDVRTQNQLDIELSYTFTF
jgi:hypothetical protein